MVFAETGSSVHTVMIGGRIVFHDGKLLTLDEGLLRRDAQEAALRLDPANDVALAGAAAVARFVGMFCAAHGSTGHPPARNLGVVRECERHRPFHISWGDSRGV